MENKINVAEILKKCPRGMELDCTMYDNAKFDYIASGSMIYPIKIQTPDGQIGLNKYGCYSNSKEAKCVIFPKGRTTWEGFQMPFKDGDILVSSLGNPFIFKKLNGYSNAAVYCALNSYDHIVFDNDNWTSIVGCRLATEGEKEKLFKAINDNGYKWNPETKFLESLSKLNFKIGDRIKQKRNYVSGIVTDIASDFYKVEFTGDVGISYINIKFQDEWELITNKFDINTLVPFESRVLVRDMNSEKWKSNFWGFYDIDSVMDYPYECCGNTFAQCIPYEGNEHLIGTTDDCDEFYKTWE